VNEARFGQLIHGGGSDMLLGKIIKSNSHTDYVCQIYAPGEVETPPIREDYSFGTFVQVELGDDRWLVGIIHDTMLVNPDFARLGPRLSPGPELAVFSPDYLNEKALLVGIAAVGIVDASGNVAQGVPSLAASTDALVERMTNSQIRTFHQGNPAPQLAYAPLLIAQAPPLILPLLRQVIARLTSLFPDQEDLLRVLEDDLAWRTQISPLGGAL
jgi:hypothetical protein